MRFWAHDETTQPNLVLPLTPAALAPQLALGVHDRVVPELEYRDCNAAGVRLHKRWALRNHYNGIGLAGGSISYATPPGFVHTFRNLVVGASCAAPLAPVPVQAAVPASPALGLGAAPGAARGTLPGAAAVALLAAALTVNSTATGRALQSCPGTPGLSPPACDLPT